jgi:hypothetical protein
MADRDRNAFLLGAGKAGSTTLARILEQHPGILLSTPKEPLFFELEYERGVDAYNETYFPGDSGERWKVDARPANLFLPFVPSRIAETFPNAPLMVILRNPTDRAFSAWLHRWLRWSDHIPVAPFEDEVASDLDRLQRGVTFTPESWRDELVLLEDGWRRAKSPLIVDSGHYAVQLERYLSLFPPTQLHVTFLEELSHPATVPRVFQFLDLPQHPVVTSTSNRRPDLYRQGLLGKATSLAVRTRLHQRLPMQIRRRLRRMAETPEVRLSPETRQLLDEHYRPHNRRLAELLRRELPADWAT